MIETVLEKEEIFFKFQPSLAGISSNQPCVHKSKSLSLVNCTHVLQVKIPPRWFKL